MLDAIGDRGIHVRHMAGSRSDTSLAVVAVRTHRCPVAHVEHIQYTQKLQTFKEKAAAQRRKSRCGCSPRPQARARHTCTWKGGLMTRSFFIGTQNSAGAATIRICTWLGKALLTSSTSERAAGRPCGLPMGHSPPEACTCVGPVAAEGGLRGGVDGGGGPRGLPPPLRRSCRAARLSDMSQPWGVAASRQPW